MLVLRVKSLSGARESRLVLVKYARCSDNFVAVVLNLQRKCPSRSQILAAMVISE